VIQQLLTFNRGVEPEKEKIVISEVLEEVVLLMRPQISNKVKVEVVDHTNGIHILADRSQIRQVFLNLVSNAAYAVREKEKGSVRVEMDLIDTRSMNNNKYPGLKEGRWLRVRTIDNGEGIPPPLTDKVFDPFCTTKPVGQGSGMGLSVVHGIIQNHNGVVQLESTPGEGTVFTVFLPVGDG
jgi:signal transduction histidine kinase